MSTVVGTLFPRIVYCTIIGRTRAINHPLHSGQWISSPHSCLRVSKRKQTNATTDETMRNLFHIAIFIDCSIRSNEHKDYIDAHAQTHTHTETRLIGSESMLGKHEPPHKTHKHMHVKWCGTQVGSNANGNSLFLSLTLYLSISPPFYRCGWATNFSWYHKPTPTLMCAPHYSLCQY